MTFKELVFFAVFLLAIVFGGIAWGGDLSLTWVDNSDNEDGFKVERKLGQQGTFAVVATVATNVITYQDTVDNQLYCYRVLAFNSAGNSPPTNEACGSTATTPLGPGTLTITITLTP